MKPTKDEIKELCAGLGWLDMGVQKNLYMMSFRQEETNRRVNIYPTTMTVTIDDERHQQSHHRNIKTLEALEIILTT